MTVIKTTKDKNPVKPGDRVGFIDLTPRLSPEQWMDLIEQNMKCLRKEFGPGWTKASKIGGVYAKDSLQKAVDARYAFISRWRKLLDADLYILDYICRTQDFPRFPLPGVVTEVIVKVGNSSSPIRIVVIGKPFLAIPEDDLKAEIERIIEYEHGETDDEIKKKVEYYLRGHDYETLDIEKTISMEVK